MLVLLHPGLHRSIDPAAPYILRATAMHAIVFVGSTGFPLSWIIWGWRSEPAVMNTMPG